jgi:hypothetical protein
MKTPPVFEVKENKKESVPPAGTKLTEDQIRQLAYRIYRARNGDAGDPIRDWLSAEEELRKAVRQTATRERALLAAAEAGADDGPVC